MNLASSRQREPQQRRFNFKSFRLNYPFSIKLTEKIPRPICGNFFVCFTLEQARGLKESAGRIKPLPPKTCLPNSDLPVLDPYEIHGPSCFAKPLLKRKSKGPNKGCTPEARSERTSRTFGGRRTYRKQRTIPRSEPLVHTPLCGAPCGARKRCTLALTPQSQNLVEEAWEM